MVNEKKLARMVVDGWKAEIDHAIDRAQQRNKSERDQWFRREWHRTAAVSKWPEERQRRYRQWKQRQRQASGEEDAWHELKEQQRKRLAWVDKAMKGLW